MQINCTDEFYATAYSHFVYFAPAIFHEMEFWSNESFGFKACYIVFATRLRSI